MSVMYKRMTQNKRLELATTLVCYQGMYKFSFSKIKLLFVTPSFRKQLLFPKLI